MNQSATDASEQIMRAATVAGPGKIELVQAPTPEPSDDEVVFRVEGCGVCASSLPLFEGRDWFSYPAEPGGPGHEAWGTVVKTGKKVKQFVAGDRIAALSYNGFAEYDKARAAHAVKLPHGVDVFPGEPLACAMNIFRRSEIRANHTVAIVGCGFLGAVLIQLCKHKGARVIAISKRAHSLETAKRAGADEVIEMDDHTRIIEKVKELTAGKFCHRVIEATGKEWPLNLASEITMVRGRLIIAGYHQDGMRNVNVQLWNWRGIDVVNAHEREPGVYRRGMEEALRAVQAGVINPNAFFSYYPLSDIQKAFEHLQSRPEGFIKAIIKN